MNVLVIDDHPEVAIAVLTCAGHAVRTAVTASDGLALLASMAFDAVVLDLGLPDVGDTEAWARQVRTLFAGRIVVSSAALPDTVYRLGEMIGARALSKPHGRADLLRSVEGA